jgi:hypothetical protein
MRRFFVGALPFSGRAGGGPTPWSIALTHLVSGPRVTFGDHASTAGRRVHFPGPRANSECRTTFTGSSVAVRGLAAQHRPRPSH